MSNIRVTGTLLTPFNTPASNVPIRITSKISYGDVIKSSVSEYMCDASGGYDFDLMYGYHTIEIQFAEKFVNLGDIGIGNETLSPLALDDLIGAASIPPTAPALVEMRQIQAEVDQDATDAAASAAAAASSAQSITTDVQSVNAAAGEATSAASSAASSASAAGLSATEADNSASTASTQANAAGLSATEADNSASTASTQANAASVSAGNASTSETNAAASASAALVSQNAAAQSATDAANAAAGLTSGVVPLGPWDASAGAFPNQPTDTAFVHAYRVDVAGTMTTNGPAGQQPLTVAVNDVLYSTITTGIWYKVIGAAVSTFDPTEDQNITGQWSMTNPNNSFYGDGSNLTGLVAGGPSVGTLSVIRTNAITIDEDITIPLNTNGTTAGPITISDGYTVTISDGACWTVL